MILSNGQHEMLTESRLTSTIPSQAITLTEPWASLVVLLLKRYETRGWPTRFRKTLFVHAAKGMPRYAREAVCTSPFLEDLTAAFHVDTASQVLEVLDARRGHIIGQCEIRGCHRSEDVRGTLSDRECAYGDYSDDRYAFAIERAVAFDSFIPCRGMLGIWTVPADTLAALQRAA
jgi:hypothetical protein